MSDHVWVQIDVPSGDDWSAVAYAWLPALPPIGATLEVRQSTPVPGSTTGLVNTSCRWFRVTGLNVVITIDNSELGADPSTEVTVIYAEEIDADRVAPRRRDSLVDSIDAPPPR